MELITKLKCELSVKLDVVTCFLQFQQGILYKPAATYAQYLVHQEFLYMVYSTMRFGQWL